MRHHECAGRLVLKSLNCSGGPHVTTTGYRTGLFRTSRASPGKLISPCFPGAYRSSSEDQKVPGPKPLPRLRPFLQHRPQPLPLVVQPHRRHALLAYQRLHQFQQQNALPRPRRPRDPEERNPVVVRRRLRLHHPPQRRPHQLQQPRPSHEGPFPQIRHRRPLPHQHPRRPRYRRKIVLPQRLDGTRLLRALAPPAEHFVPRRLGLETAEIPKQRLHRRSQEVKGSLQREKAATTARQRGSASSMTGSSRPPSRSATNRACWSASPVGKEKESQGFKEESWHC